MAAPSPLAAKLTLPTTIPKVASNTNPDKDTDNDPYCGKDNHDNNNDNHVRSPREWGTMAVPSWQIHGKRRKIDRIDSQRFYARHSTATSKNKKNKTPSEVEWEKKIEAIRKAVADLKKLGPLPPIQRHDLVNLKPRQQTQRFIWKEFSRQEQALQFGQSIRTPVHVFSYEILGFSDGRRRFVAASYDSFWKRYEGMRLSQRHFYEVISESTPCKLYFDLEFKRSENPQLPPSVDTEIIETLITCVHNRLRQRYKRTTFARDQILDLDSTTAVKFSRHLIFTDTVFIDNIHMGRFVNEVINHISQSNNEQSNNEHSDNEQGDTEQQRKLLLVYTTDRNKTDVSRNEHGASKNEHDASTNEHDSSKNNHEGSKNDHHASKDEHDTSKDEHDTSKDEHDASRNNERDQNDHHERHDQDHQHDQHNHFEQRNRPTSSLIDHGVYTRNRNFRLWLSSKVAKNIPLVVANRNEMLKYDNPTDKHVFLSSLICNVPSSLADKLLQYHHHHASSTSQPSSSSSSSSVSTTSATTTASSGTSVVTRSTAPTSKGYRASPYPSVDEFILAISSARGHNTSRIRRWLYFEESKVLTYDIAGNRFCDNIGREHKSNGVFYVVNIQHATFYQKCYDPDCKAVGFRSELRPIPSVLLPSVNDDDEDWDDWIEQRNNLEALDAVLSAVNSNNNNDDDDDDDNNNNNKNNNITATNNNHNDNTNTNNDNDDDDNKDNNDDDEFSDAELDALIQQNVVLEQAVSGSSYIPNM